MRGYTSITNYENFRFKLILKRKLGRARWLCGESLARISLAKENTDETSCARRVFALDDLFLKIAHAASNPANGNGNGNGS